MILTALRRTKRQKDFNFISDVRDKSKNPQFKKYLELRSDIERFIRHDKVSIASINDKLRYLTDIQKSSMTFDSEFKMSNEKVLKFKAKEFIDLIENDKRFEKFIVISKCSTGEQAVVNIYGIASKFEKRHMM